MTEVSQSDADNLVATYIDAWNQADVTALLELMHPGAAYYDAFWMESCVGRDLAQYFHDAMDEEPYIYKQVGDTIRTENGVVFRYSAHSRAESKAASPILLGAEILILRGPKILTVTDFYFSPDHSDLEEVAELAAVRHGLPRHANSGLGALKAARIKANLSVTMDSDKVHLDPDMTVSELAEIIGCTLGQLSTVIERHFGTSVEDFLDTRRIEYAKDMLSSDPDSFKNLTRAAASAGFKSSREFSKKFLDIVGMTPTDFCRRQRKKGSSPGRPRLH